jgi:DHA1 family inner membrane transport protein
MRASLLRTHWPLYGLLFLIGTENFIVSPLLPALAQDTGIPVGRLAGMVTSYAVTYAVLAPVLGQVADKIGRVTLIALGGVLFVAGNFAVALGSELSTLLVARGVMGLGGAMAGPAVWAYIADSTAVELQGHAMGMGMGAFSLGQIVGIPIGGVVAELMSWRLAFGGIGMLLIPLIVLIGLVARSRAHGPSQAFSPASGIPLFSIWSNATVRYLLAITFLFHAGNLATYTFLGDLLTSTFRLSTGQVGLIGLLVGVGSLIGALGGGKLCDLWRARARRREELVMCWSVTLAAAILVTTYAGVFVVVAVAIICWFVASGAFVTTQQTLLTAAAPEARATAVSWNNSIMYLGTGAGVWTLGATAHYHLGIGVIGAAFALGAAAVATTLNTFSTMVSEEVA